jgi:death-on-curing protein
LPSDIFWLTPDDAIEIHENGLIEFGGLPGIRDENLLHSALDAPQQLHAYEGECDILRLGLRLCLRLAKNHPFNDGNKRVALGCMIEFLGVNGYDLDSMLDSSVSLVLKDVDPSITLLSDLVKSLAAGEMSEESAYDTLRIMIRPVSAS